MANGLLILCSEVDKITTPVFFQATNSKFHIKMSGSLKEWLSKSQEVIPTLCRLIGLP